MCIVFEWIEDRKSEMRTSEAREREVTTFKARKTQELPEELIQTWAEGGDS